MRTRPLGPLQVSEIGLGTSSFTRWCGEQAARDVVAAALAHGITFVDTADSYGAGRCGRAEEVLGAALRGRRDEVVLATKFGTEFAGPPASARAERAREGLRGSLRRLRTDRVELFLLHVPDPAVPLAETLGALDELVDAGLARMVGCANLSAEQLAEAAALADGLRLAPFRCVQDSYSVLDRRVEADVLPHCRARGLGFVCYAPLAGGLLTAKYGDGVPDGSRAAQLAPDRAALMLAPADVARSRRFAALCAAAGRRPVPVALGWLLSRPGVTSVIPGATTPAQVAELAAGAEPVDPELLAAVDALPATDPVGSPGG